MTPTADDRGASPDYDRHLWGDRGPGRVYGPGELRVALEGGAR